MGQKVRPTGFRTGISMNWLSTWYAGKQEFADLLVEDQRIREVIKERFGAAGISRVEIHRTRERVTVCVHAAQVATITGWQGQGIEWLTQDLSFLFQRRFRVQALEVSCPERDAQLVAECIVEQMQHRQGFRRAMRRAVQAAMQAGARGIKVQLAGRLNGSEVARTESTRAGSLPLSTLRAQIGHGFAEASTAEGCIGIQVWINNGEGPGAV
jgi:small subunit ribosomal protein S3